MLKLKKTYTAKEIASWFVVRNDTEHFINKYIDTSDQDHLCFDTEIADFTNTHIQKLLYFAQGFSFFNAGESLFSDDIQAQKNGPVVEEVCTRYKYFKNNRVIPSKEDVSNFLDVQDDDAANLILEKVYRHYCRLEAGELIAITHEEKPWYETNGCKKGTRVGNDTKNVIPQEKIKDSFINEKLKGKNILKEEDLAFYDGNSGLIDLFCSPENRQDNLELYNRPFIDDEATTSAEDFLKDLEENAKN